MPGACRSKEQWAGRALCANLNTWCLGQVLDGAYRRSMLRDFRGHVRGSDLSHFTLGETTDGRQGGGMSGTGLIWNRIPFDTPVIPAKAGIQSVGGEFPMACRVDSRLHGNDCARERACLANDTTTECHGFGSMRFFISLRIRSGLSSGSPGLASSPGSLTFAGSKMCVSDGKAV